MDLAEGIKALVLGMSAVFVVLILISIIISLLKYINPVDKASKTPAENKAPIIQIPTNQPVVENGENDLELVAVITAAIAASLNTSTDRFKVVSFRKMKTNNRWNMR